MTRRVSRAPSSDFAKPRHITLTLLPHHFIIRATFMPFNPARFPQHIYGLHDIGGQDRLLSAGRTGWVVDRVSLRSHAGADYSTLADAGIGVIAHLNEGDESQGALPPPERYAEFAARCAAYANKSPGARAWIIGGALNTRGATSTREIVTPADYAECFRACRAAIKTLPRHADDLVIAGAVTPFNADAGDWVNYFAALLNALADANGAPAADGIALNAGTHDYALDQITSDAVMDAPFAGRHYHFRAYRDFLAAVPENFRALPVFLTQAHPFPGWGNANIGWIQRAYQEINNWNSDEAHQPIQALALYRWRARGDADAWALQTKPALMDDLRAALHADYRARWRDPSPESQVQSQKSRVDSSESQVQNPKTPAAPHFDARFLAHDTPVCLTIAQTTTVNLRVKNIGAGAWTLNGIAPTHVGYRWLGGDGKPSSNAEDRRTALPRAVAPNQEIALGARLAAPRAPGIYQLHWDLVGAGAHWFADSGSAPLVVPVRVTELPQAISGWRVESNMNPNHAAFALDGDAKTFWDAGKPQTAGQWFRVNLDAPRVIDGLQFLSPGKGFPAAYSLRLSADGKTWIEISRVVGNSSDVIAIFAPLRAQYAQIDLCADAAAQWQIADILAHPAAEWRAHASHCTENAVRAVDNRVESAWSSEARQAAGMWFQLDLGRAEKVSGLMLIAPADEFPRGVRVSLWNARASRWQIAAEKTGLAANPEFIFAPTPTQFINLQLLAPSDAVWGIQHLRVYREMEEWMGTAGINE